MTVKVRPAPADDDVLVGMEFLAADTHVLRQSVSEISQSARRWCPIWSRLLALQASVSFLMLLGGLCASGYRIYLYEQAYMEQLRATAAESGQRGLNEFSRRYQNTASSTLTLAAVVELDAGDNLLGPNAEELIKAAVAQGEHVNSEVVDKLTPEAAAGLMPTSSGRVEIAGDEVVGLENVPPEIREAILKAIKEGSSTGGVIVVAGTHEQVTGSELEAVKEQINKGQLVVSEAPFIRIGASFSAAHEGISSMMLAPMGLVTLTCCDDRHEGQAGGLYGVGVDLFQDPDLGKVLNASLAGERWTLGAVGPLNGTGGRVLLVHCPVFIKARPGISFRGLIQDHPTYWGSILVELEIPRLLGGTSLARLHDRGYSFVLHSDSPEGPALWAASPDVPGQPPEPGSPWSDFARRQHPVELSMSLEGFAGPVRLLVWPSAGWKEHSDGFALQLVLSGVLFLLSLATFYVGLLRQSVLSRIRGIAKQFSEEHAELQRRYAISP